MLGRKACVLGRGLGLAVLVSLGALASCAGSEEEALGRSVVLITLDSTRLDALGAFGGLPGTTPNLDALAGESVGYRWARTVAPLTLPAHTSMFTGFYPLRHGVRGNGPMLVPKEAETLAERARWAGYETAGFVGSLALDWDFGIAQGFRVWRQPDPGGGPAGGGPATEEAEGVIGKAIHWLTRRNPTQPFFLWVHLQDAHAPYTPAPDFYDRPDPYLAEVSGVDRALGRLLDALGEARALDAGLIAVVGDHGEGRGDHGEETHGLYCYDSTLRVPFLLHYPDGWRAGEQSDEVVSVVDVFPTLLEFMGMPVPQGLDGVSLLRRAVSEERGVYFESYYGWQRFGWSPLAGWADAEGKYVHGSAPQYFRPLLDPEESTDWIEEDFDRARYIEAIRRLDLEPKLAHDNDFSVRPEVLADLAALGYGASAAEGGAAFPHPLEDSLRPAPREQAEEFADYRRARDLIAMGDYTAAVPLLEAMCALNPSNPASLDLLGTALCSSHDYARAVPVLQQRLALSPERMSTHRDLVTCYEALGDARAAQHHSVRSLELLVRTHERRGEQDEASRARGLLGRVRARELPQEPAGDAGAGSASDA